MVSVVHNSCHSYESRAKERYDSDPGFNCVPSLVEQMKLASQIQAKEAQTSPGGCRQAFSLILWNADFGLTACVTRWETPEALLQPANVRGGADRRGRKAIWNRICSSRSRLTPIQQV